MAPEVVEIRDLTVKYGHFTAVKGVSFSLGSGSFGLLGRNGAGKTTILRALLGLVPPSGGILRVLGVDSAGQAASVRARVGYLPEGQVFFPGMTGFQAVAYAGRLSGLPRRTARKRAHEMLYFAGLGEARYRSMDGYSTGMIQRVKLAMALVHDPPLLFLDEPTNGLDPAGRKQMLERVRELAGKKGKTLILSSHILSDVEEVCDEALLLHEGEVLERGLLAELTAAAPRVREVLASGEGDALRAALEKRDILVLRIERAGSFLKLRVGLPPGAGGREVFQAVSEAGGALRSLVEVRRSLEEVFGKAVGGEV